MAQATKEIDPSKNWHDIFTYALAQKFPVNTVEAITDKFIKELQYKGFATCGFNARERNIWYYTPQEGVDKMTIDQLLSVGIDFHNHTLENIYPELTKDADYYNGIFFAHIEVKGEYLLHLLQDKSEKPVKIVFIDDKQSQVNLSPKHYQTLGIDHECYHYIATEPKAAAFDPLTQT